MTPLTHLARASVAAALIAAPAYGAECRAGADYAKPSIENPALRAALDGVAFCIRGDEVFVLHDGRAAPYGGRTGEAWASVDPNGETQIHSESRWRLDFGDLRTEVVLANDAWVVRAYDGAERGTSVSGF